MSKPTVAIEFTARELFLLRIAVSSWYESIGKANAALHKPVRVYLRNEVEGLRHEVFELKWKIDEMPTPPEVKRLRAALLILRQFGGMGAGQSYSASVIADMARWVDGGCVGPLPRPECPFFTDWASRQPSLQQRGIFDDER